MLGSAAKHNRPAPLTSYSPIPKHQVSREDLEAVPEWNKATGCAVVLAAVSLLQGSQGQNLKGLFLTQQSPEPTFLQGAAEQERWPMGVAFPKSLNPSVLISSPKQGQSHSWG